MTLHMLKGKARTKKDRQFYFTALQFQTSNKLTDGCTARRACGAPWQPDRAAACGRAGIWGVSGSGLMSCMPCVLPRPGTRCIMLVCVGADVVCLCLWVSSDGVFAVPVVCDRTRAGAAVQFCAWSPWQRSRPMSWWGGSRALWARGVTWGGRIASRLCPNRVCVRASSGRKLRDAKLGNFA